MNTDRNLPPTAVLLGMLTGYSRAQALHVAAVLGIADRLATGPRVVDDLAREAGADGPSLYRLLRALASEGIFAEGEGRAFKLTPLAEPLRRDHPATVWAAAVAMGGEHYRAWGELLYSVRTGKTAFDHLYGQPFFNYLSTNPESAAVFDKLMTAVHGGETTPMLDAYDFGRFGTVADVGGGNGLTLRGILGRFPSVRGILFDRPHVAERGEAAARSAGLGDRFRAVGGDFFESVPTADACLLRHIIHDWDDVRSVRILRNCRNAVAPGGVVLVVETLIPAGNGPAQVKWLDLTMLTVPGGLERTAEEYHKLYASAGLRVTRIVPTAQDISIVEGVPV